MDFFEFFSTLTVEDAAQALLGARLTTPDCSAQIVEVEAYGGSEDPASHAHKRQTPRNQIMFDRAGLLYMYFNYGVHWMANVTCLPQDQPGAVLIRAAIPLTGLEAIQARRPQCRQDEKLLSGPGNLTQGLGLNGSHYGTDLFEPGSPIRIFPGSPPANIMTTTRIGIAKGKGETWPRRFIDRSNLRWCSEQKLV